MLHPVETASNVLKSNRGSLIKHYTLHFLNLILSRQESCTKVPLFSSFPAHSEASRVGQPADTPSGINVSDEGPIDLTWMRSREGPGRAFCFPNARPTKFGSHRGARLRDSRPPTRDTRGRAVTSRPIPQPNSQLIGHPIERGFDTIFPPLRAIHI